MPGVFSLQAKIERRFLGKNFLPSYFNPFYESERFQITEALERVRAQPKRKIPVDGRYPIDLALSADAGDSNR